MSPPATMLVAISATATAVISAAPTTTRLYQSIPLATFDGGKGTTFKWEAENDPVMGGQSVSTFTPDAPDKMAVWAGEVKVVPFLHAPGFCTCHTTDANLPDMSSYAGGGFVLKLKSTPGKTNLTQFQFQFSIPSADQKKGSYTGKFELTPGTEYGEIYAPFSSFACSWRGEPEGGPPTAKQLRSLRQIGIGADGVAGTFELDVVSISVANQAPGPSPPPPSPPAPPAGLLELVSFQKGSPHLYTWTDLNDPVMGGKSTSTFTISQGFTGVFNGTVAIVPQLKAPGFCNAEGRAGLGKKMPDASSTLGGGLVYRVRSTGAMSSFKAAFGNGAEGNFNSYKADFDVPNNGLTVDVKIPYALFSNKWSSATGEPTVKCSADPKVCPTKSALGKLGSIGVWAEGKAGDFHLELIGIYAYGPGTEHQQI